jgi:enoyl-CoA hydratase/carnithine racemase
MEIVLGGDDIDAVTAERWGLLNRALPPDELTAFVDRLASRIASFPPGAVALAKQSILNAESMPLRDGLLEEAYLFQQTLRLPGTPEAMLEFLARGGQTRDGELRVADLMTD